MRNRVGFSYIEKYNSENYDKYAYTIFLAYADDTTDKQANVWFNGIKYTYLKNNVNSFSYHDRGTSYINQKDNIVSAYEYEYDRYVNVVTSNIDNNTKQIVNSTKDNNGHILPVEQIISYVQVEENSYTYYPSFVEGFTAYDYTIQKIAYGATTGNIPHGEYNFNLNSYGMFLGTNDTDLSYNICGTYDNGNTSYKIIGIGIDDTKIPHDGLSSKKEYTNIITAYVYILKSDRQDEISRVFNNDELYEHLRIYIPGLNDRDGCISGHASSYSYLSFTDSFNNIGSVLAIAELDYKNNKYKLRRKINFIAGSDRIVDIDKIYFGVNGFDTVRSSLLNGDNIEAIYVRTTPSNANNVLGLKFGYNDSYTYVNGSAESYIGVDEKTDNSNRYFIYDLGAYNEHDSYYINAPADATYTYSYIYSNNGFDTIKQHPIYHVTIEDPIMSYHIFFESESHPGLNVDDWTFVTDNHGYDIIDTNRRTLKCTIDDTSFSIFNKYPNRINRNNSYHIIDVNCEYSYEYINDNGVIDTYKHIYGYTYTGTHDPIHSGLAYSTYNIDNYELNTEPGRYLLSYHLQNGVIENDGYIFGPNSYINRLYVENASFNEIYTYEGAIGVSLVEDSNYILYDNDNEYVLDNEYLKFNAYDNRNTYNRNTYVNLKLSKKTPNNLYNMHSFYIGSLINNDESIEPGQYYRLGFFENDSNDTENDIEPKSIKLYHSNNFNKICNNYYENVYVYRLGINLKYPGGNINDELNATTHIINESNSITHLDVSQLQQPDASDNYYKFNFNISYLADMPEDVKKSFNVTFNDITYNDNNMSVYNDNDDNDISYVLNENNLTLNINKNKNVFVESNDYGKYIKLNFDLKLQSNNSDINNYDYLGFNNRTSHYTTYIYNSIENIEEDGLPDTLNLFTNVRDAKDNTSEGPTPYIYQYSQTENVEKFIISQYKLNDDGWINNNSDNLDIDLLKIDQNNGYITFEPKYNNDNENIVKIKLKYTTNQNTNSAEENEHTIRLIPFKFSFAINGNPPNSNNELNVSYLTKYVDYKKSVTDESNITAYTYTNNGTSYTVNVLKDYITPFYYEEILIYKDSNDLGDEYNLLNDTYYKINLFYPNERGFFIHDFCGKECENNFCMLDYIGIKKHTNTNNVLIPDIHFKLKFIYGNGSNIPNGVIFKRSWHDNLNDNMEIKYNNDNDTTKKLCVALVYSKSAFSFYPEILGKNSHETKYIEPSSINKLNIMKLEYSHEIPSNNTTIITTISQPIKFSEIKINNDKKLYTNGQNAADETNN